MFVQRSNPASGRATVVAGYTLPTVLAMAALLSVSVSVMFSALVSASRSSGDMLRRRKAFYACDGLARSVTSRAQQYMAIDSTPTSAELRTYVCGGTCPGSVSSLLPANYSVTSFTVDTVGASEASVPLPSGPFKGMNARLDTIEMAVEAEHNTMGYRCETAQTVSLGKVALFQFYVFGDTYFDGHPGPTMTLEGRAHINYDACLGGNIRASKVTSAGSLWAGGNGNCRYNIWNGVRIRDGGGTYVSFNTGNDSSVAGWHDRALTTWDGNALDEAHDVPKLRPPVTGDPVTQLGAHAQNAKNEETTGGTGGQAASEDNSQNLRFLVDPVRAADSTDVREQRFSWLADIRIINGTWYKNDGTFPGKAIWSDHPGRFNLANNAMQLGMTLQGSQQGQRDINDANGYGTTPMRYSLYSFGNTNATQTQLVRGTAGGINAPMPVISYGTLERQTIADANNTTHTTPFWRTASWVTKELCPQRLVQVPLDPLFAAVGGAVPTNVSTLLGAGNTILAARAQNHGTNPYEGASIDPGASPAGMVPSPIWNENTVTHSNYRSMYSGVNAGTCTNGVQLTSGDVILNASRGGFFDGHRGGMYSNMADTQYRAQVLPVNFDVEAFEQAMITTTGGELGSHFSGGNDFNGIVWISYPYPGMLNGMQSGGDRANVVVANMQGDGTVMGAIPSGTHTGNPMGAPPLITGRSILNNATLGYGGLLSIPDAIAFADTNGLLAPLPADTIDIAAGHARGISAADFTPSSASAQDVFATHVPSINISHFTHNHHNTTQNELPFPLCTNDAGLLTAGRDPVTNRSNYARFGPSGQFHVSRCSDYIPANAAATGTPGTVGGWITGVRVMNGRNLNSSVFKKGLSIITNMPVYVLGDMNNDSTPFSDETLPASGSGEWIPLLIGGDVMYHMSNAWVDNRANWATYSRENDRRAIVTTFNIAELIGWVPSHGGVGGTRFHNLQGYLEDWGGVNHNINGSVAIGWKAVVNRNNRTSGGAYAYTPPYRNWSFDTNYQYFVNQPPGTPTFDVAATRKFKRD